MDDMAMDDDVTSDMLRREELRLIKAFLGIADPRKRREIIELAEQLANEAGSEAAHLTPTAPEASPGETSGDLAGRSE